MKTVTIGILLYGTDARERDAAAEEKYRVLVEQMKGRAWDVSTLSYHDSWRDPLREKARRCDAVLAWINPTEPQLDRAALDEFLRDLSRAGVVVSAHPDTILRIGTKDVLVATQSLGWSVDAVAYRSLGDFETRFPELVRRSGPRVLKQYRGHSGQGVWKVAMRPDGRFEVTSATRGEGSRVHGKTNLIAFFDQQVFARGSHLVDQRWVPTMDRGMVRAYICGTKVAGFGFQEIVALHPTTPSDDFTRQQPSRRHYYTENCHLFSRLRERMDTEWIPVLSTLLGLRQDDFPLLWDADFFFGDAAEKFLLCEINASCVSPFPESAITPMIVELERRLAARG